MKAILNKIQLRATLPSALTVLSALIISYGGYAQDGVQIDYTTPTVRDPRAILQLNSANQGFLVPRVASTGDVGIPSTTGVLVYQTGGTAGFYYWDGTAWVMIANTGAGIVTADNGLNVNTGNNVRLGGTISVNPTNIALAGNVLTFSGTGNSEVAIGTTTPSTAARLYSESASSGFEAIRGANKSSSTTGAFAAIRGELTHANYTNASGYLGYHTTTNTTYGVYGTSGDYGGVFARPVSISAVAPTSTGNDLEVRNITGSNPVQVFLRQGVSNATSGTVLSNLDFGDNNTSTGQARMQAVRDAASSGSSDLPTAITFSTTPDNTSTMLERMRIANSGEVRLLTNALNTRGFLQAVETGTNNGAGGGSGLIIATSGGENIAFKDAGLAGDENLSIMGASGNVGIGATNPQQRLHVAGNARVTALAAGANGAIVRSNTSGDLAITNFSGTATDVLTGAGTFVGISTISGDDWTQSGNFLYPNTLGWNVGIGLNNPAAKLDVLESGLNTAAAQLKHTNATNSNGLNIETQTTNAADYALRVAPNAGATTGLIVRNTGNVGIGVTSPLSKLHITGAGGLDEYIRLENTGTARFSRIGHDGSGVFFRVSNNGDTYRWTDAAGTVLMSLNPNTTNLGIGNSAANQKLEVTGNARITALASGGSGAIVRSNTSGDLAITNFSGTATDVLTGAGTFVGISTISGDDWTQSGSQLYPNDLTWNVGIGTSSPSGMLHVGTAANRSFLVGSNGLTTIRFDDNSTPAVLTLENRAMTAINHGVNLNFGLNIGGGASLTSGQIKMGAEDTYAAASNRDAYMALSTMLDGTLAERLRIISSGNVGINTTAPASLFSVGSTSQFQVNSVGDIRTISNVTPTNGAIRLNNNFLINAASGFAAIVNFDNGTTGANRALVVGDGASGTGNFYVYADGQAFATNWWRSLNNTGWYNQTWGGGWYMDNATHVKSYGDKSVYVVGTGNTLRVDGLKAASGSFYSGSTATTSSIMYANNSTGDIYALPPANNAILVTGATGIPSWQASTGTGVQGYWTRSGTLLYNTNQSDNVGIGTTNPLARLDIGRATSGNKALMKFHPGTATGIDYNGYAHHDFLMGSYEVSGYSQHYISFGYTADAQRKFHIGSADNATFSSAGFAPAFTVMSGGNVGVGNSSPGARFEVRKNDGGNAFRFANYIDGGSLGAWVGTYGAEFRTVTSGTTHGMLINHNEANDGRRTLDVSDANGVFASFVNGKVGIGNTSPSFKLDVTGTARIGTTGGVAIYSTDANTVNFRPSIGNGDILITDDSGTPARGMTITNGGNIGIGTATAPNKLQVESTVADAIHLKANTSGTAPYHVAMITAEANIDYRGRGLFLPTTDAAAGASWFAGVPYTGGGFQIGNSNVHTYQDGNGPYILANAKLFIKPDGNVGIGTTNPAAKLDILGNGTSNYRGIMVTNTYANTASKGAMTIIGSRYTTANTPYSVLGNWDNGSTRNIYIGGGGWGMPDATNISFYTAPVYDENINTGVERMRIQADGNVGIATTAPTSTLDVNGAVRIRGGSPATNSVLTSSDANGNAVWTTPASLNTAYDGSVATASGTANILSSTTTPTLAQGTYFVVPYHCLSSTSADYYIVFDAVATSGTITGGYAVYYFNQLNYFTVNPFIIKVQSATATVNFRVRHGNGGTITNTAGSCMGFSYWRIGN